MSRVLFGLGSRGDIVRQIQRSLVDARISLPSLDEIYGRDTRAAVAAFQAGKGAPPSGAVDLDTWSSLTGAPVPGIGERALQLTAAFEGHNYTLAVGDFDGAWLTWGIIGFTMAHGEVQNIIRAIDESAPALIGQAFGANAAALRSIVTGGADQQKSWAQANTTNGGGLAEPWKSAFAAFGNFPEVRAEQRRRAFDDYFAPAVKTAARFQLTSELGMALAFDIHVQNGGIGDDSTAAIRSALARIANPTELQRREIIANAVADHARAQYREDVRTRKLAIARGSGSVHGRAYQLENWGLAEIAEPGE
jgi:peptidoglycan hydrolase-like protein with peptidoglycan-binding domain